MDSRLRGNDGIKFAIAVAPLDENGVFLPGFGALTGKSAVEEDVPIRRGDEVGRDVGSAHVVGHSLGGVIAQLMAVQHPAPERDR